MQKVLKDTPLADITLRRYEKPTKLADRDIVKKFCLSVGLLQPGDSRDVIVDILVVLLKARQEKKLLHSDEITKRAVEERKKAKLPLSGIAHSNIRRQVKRLRETFLVEKTKNNYRITEFDSLRNSFQQKTEQFLLQSILERVKDYANAVDERFK